MTDEKRMTAMYHGQLYQCRAEQAFNKKVKPRVFEEGNLVLKKYNQALPDHRGKFAPTYKGSYVVKKAFSKGALILADMDGMTSICPPTLMLSYGTLHEGAFQCTSFLCQKKNKKRKTKKNNKKQKYVKR